MPLDITITLSDGDLQKFQESINKGKLAVDNQESAEAIEQKAYELIELATGGNLPQFVHDRILKLQILLNMRIRSCTKVGKLPPVASSISSEAFYSIASALS